MYLLHVAAESSYRGSKLLIPTLRVDVMLQKMPSKFAIVLKLNVQDIRKLVASINSFEKRCLCQCLPFKDNEYLRWEKHTFPVEAEDKGLWPFFFVDAFQIGLQVSHILEKK